MLVSEEEGMSSSMGFVKSISSVSVGSSSSGDRGWSFVVE